MPAGSQRTQGPRYMIARMKDIPKHVSSSPAVIAITKLSGATEAGSQTNIRWRETLGAAMYRLSTSSFRARSPGLPQRRATNFRGTVSVLFVSLIGLTTPLRPHNGREMDFQRTPLTFAQTILENQSPGKENSRPFTMSPPLTIGSKHPRWTLRHPIGLTRMREANRSRAMFGIDLECARLW